MNLTPGTKVFIKNWGWSHSNSTIYDLIKSTFNLDRFILLETNSESNLFGIPGGGFSFLEPYPLGIYLDTITVEPGFKLFIVKHPTEEYYIAFSADDDNLGRSIIVKSMRPVNILLTL